MKIDKKNRLNITFDCQSTVKVIPLTKEKGDKITAVFDFDGTVVSKDTYFEFNKWLLNQSLLRSLAVILALPVILPLVCHSLTRRIGLNVVCFLATFVQARSLFSLRREFIDYYFQKCEAVVYSEAIQAIEFHQKKGEKIVIISGCPKWLLSGVVKSIGIHDVKLVGSEQQMFAGGLLISRHCYSENKIDMAIGAGQCIGNWGIGYSDSSADIPMLNLCKAAVLINSSKHAIKKFSRKLTVPSKYQIYS